MVANAFDQCAQDNVDKGVYAGFSPEQTCGACAQPLAAARASNVQGLREGVVPNVKRSHEEKTACVMVVLEVQEAMQWPKPMPRVRR